MKIETDTITSTASSLIGCTVILVTMYVETFKTDVIIFIGNVIMCVGVTLTDIFQYQSQLCWYHTDRYFSVSVSYVDIENITLWDPREKVQITDNFRNESHCLLNILQYSKLCLRTWPFPVVEGKIEVNYNVMPLNKYPIN